ncbi:helix-turn-helix transcriptional regulator [Streptomyces celluloflavus]|uniref:helix-turn-helix transcriptional regulator n=1 Tax=Streptomyces celluloflavus TaxID=58344 RepID=UPI00345F4716|nr:helix-turn-helix transcriptional regulator [Streptomyces celluloflavus]
MDTSMWDQPKRTTGAEMAQEVIPREHLADGEWPTGDLSQDAPLGAHLGQAIARTLIDAASEQGLSVRALARRAGVTHPTVKDILEGKRLPTTHTLLLLEAAVQKRLYPADLFLRAQN